MASSKNGSLRYGGCNCSGNLEARQRHLYRRYRGWHEDASRRYRVLYVVTPDEEVGKWAVEVFATVWDHTDKPKSIWKGYVGDKYPERKLKQRTIRVQCLTSKQVILGI